VKAVTWNLTDHALKILESRYYLKDKDGVAIENAEGLFNRVAKTIAAVEYKYGASEEDVSNLEQNYFDLM